MFLPRKSFAGCAGGNPGLCDFPAFGSRGARGSSCGLSDFGYGRTQIRSCRSRWRGGRRSSPGVASGGPHGKSGRKRGGRDLCLGSRARAGLAGGYRGRLPKAGRGGQSSGPSCGRHRRARQLGSATKEQSPLQRGRRGACLQLSGCGRNPAQTLRRMPPSRAQPNAGPSASIRIFRQGEPRYIGR